MAEIFTDDFAGFTDHRRAFDDARLLLQARAPSFMKTTRP